MHVFASVDEIMSLAADRSAANSLLVNPLLPIQSHLFLVTQAWPVHMLLILKLQLEL
jgi:hypothetical protein